MWRWIERFQTALFEAGRLKMALVLYLALAGYWGAKLQGIKMNDLLISIACSVAVSVLLKTARSGKIDIAQAVGVNYLVAVSLSAYFLKPDFGDTARLTASWPLFAALGVLLPSVFLIMGRAVDSAGIVKSDAAQRLSLFLPVAAAFALFGEQLSDGRIIGLCLAFAALGCLLWKDGGGKKAGASSALWLAGVWLGYGVIDILFKQLAKSGAAFPAVLTVSFALAGILMFGYLFARGRKWSRQSILGGVLLGCLNFGNILSYIRAHQAMKDNPTLVFAGMSIGVICVGTLVGALVFKEKISAVNAAGLVLAVAAVACLFYWPYIRGGAAF